MSHCGTTQSHTGECDSCLEGEVRYFCTNHSPGLWLDEPVCEGCGAKFGEAAARGPEPALGTAPTVPARETRLPESRPLKPRGAEPPRTGLRKPPPRVADPEDAPATPSLADLFAHLSEEPERTRYKVEEVSWREPAAEITRKSLPVMGCIVRLVLFMLLLIAIGLGGLFLLMAGGI